MYVTKIEKFKSIILQRIHFNYFNYFNRECLFARTSIRVTRVKRVTHVTRAKSPNDFSLGCSIPLDL